MDKHHPLFDYDMCVPIGDGEVHYVRCVLHDRLGPCFPGDIFDLAVLDYHKGTMDLYVAGKADPFYSASLRVTAT